MLESWRNFRERLLFFEVMPEICLSRAVFSKAFCAVSDLDFLSNYHWNGPQLPPPALMCEYLLDNASSVSPVVIGKTRSTGFLGGVGIAGNKISV